MVRKLYIHFNACGCFKIADTNLIVLFLVSCPTGSYQIFDKEKLVYDDGYVVKYIFPKCKLCPTGQYQDLQGQTLCKKCQIGYSTLTTGARFKGSCLEQCSPGSFSQTGVVPCTACPNGTYSFTDGSTSCYDCNLDGVSCPENRKGK